MLRANKMPWERVSKWEGRAVVARAHTKVAVVSAPHSWQEGKVDMFEC